MRKSVERGEHSQKVVESVVKLSLLRRSVSLCEIVGEFFKLSYWKASKSFAKRLNSIYSVLSDYAITSLKKRMEIKLHYHDNVKFPWVCQTFRVCHIFKGVSCFRDNVKLLKVCHIFKGMSNF